MRRRHAIHALTIAAALALWPAPNAFSQSISFEPAQVLLETGEAIEFARNPSDAMAVDASGGEHVVYFIADEAGDPPINRVMYLHEESGAVSTPVRADHGEAGGGRHPAIALGSDGALNLAWQDYRDSSALYNWIDNLEIYFHRSMDDRFTGPDARLTHTKASHNGDNGYAPQIAASADGTIAVAWYDFNADGGAPGVYVRRSAGGAYDDVNGIDAFRITPQDGSGTWMPDIAALNDGAFYAAWGRVEGFSGVFELQGREIGASGEMGPIEEIAPAGGNFFDPVRLAASPDGTLGAAYSLRMDGLSRVFVRMRSASGEWSDALTLDEGMVNASQPALVIGEGGLAYAAWQEDWGGLDLIQLAVIDTKTMEITARAELSDPLEDARFPVLARNPSEKLLHAAWIERGLEGERRIVSTRQVRTRVDDWLTY